MRRHTENSPMLSVINLLLGNDMQVVALTRSEAALKVLPEQCDAVVCPDLSPLGRLLSVFLVT